MTNAARLFSSLLVFCFFLAVPGEASQKAQAKPTRSIYVPVEFKLCEHLTDGVLYQGDRALALLPAKRIFQFTYYPHLDRIEPVRTDVRVEGARESGDDFVGRLAVTPWGVYSADTKIELDLQEQLDRLRYKLDVRYDSMVLRLRCNDSCRKEVLKRTADATDGPAKP